MVSPIQQTWLTAEITLKQKDDPSVTKLFTFTQREVTWSGFEPDFTFDALIVEVAGLGVQLDSFIPKNTTATITIDNSPGSIGFERRFTDFFEKFAVILQPVKIKAYTTDVVGTFSEPTSVLPKDLWEGTIKNYTIDFSTNEVSLEITNNPIPQRIITKEINVTEFPDAPTRSLGKHLPVIFGFYESLAPGDVGLLVPGYQINGDATTPDLAYATNFDSFETSGALNLTTGDIRVRDRIGRLRKVDEGGILARVSIAGADLPDLSVERAFQINYDNTANGKILTHVSVNFEGSNVAGGPVGFLDGEVTVRIYEGATAFTNTAQPPEFPVDPVIASGVRAKNDFAAQIRANAPFGVEFPLDRPVVLREGIDYWWSIFASNETNSGAPSSQGEMTLAMVIPSDGGPAGFRQRFTDVGIAKQAPGQWVGLFAPTETGDVSFFGVDFTDSPTGNGLDVDTGLSHAFFTAANDSGVSTQDINIDNLRYFIETGGLRDNGNDLGEGAGAPIFGANRIAHFLHFEWDPVAVTAVNNRYDKTIYDDTHLELLGSVAANFPREVKGYTTGRTTAQNALNEVFRNQAARLVKLSGFEPNVGTYGWGTERTDFALLDDDDLLSVEFISNGIDTIINNTKISFARETGATRTEDVTGQDGERTYLKLLQAGHSDGAFGEAISGNSEELFGDRPLGETKFNFLEETESAENVAKFYLITHDVPHEFIRIQLPYDKFRDLEALDTLTLRLPQLPSFLGSSSDPLPAIFSGDAENAEFVQSEYLVRASSKRVQINSINYNFPRGDVPTMSLLCRLLIHDSDPT